MERRMRYFSPLPMVQKHVLWALLGGLFWTLMVAAEPGVTADTITLGQTTDLSGPVADLGLEFGKGYKVFFDALNARGGVHGRKIVVVAQDDAYNSKKTLEFVDAFIKQGNTFALFGTLGTPNNEALIPIAQAAGMPVLMPITGAPSVRNQAFNGVFNLRASYADEVERLVEHLHTVGIRKIAIAYQNNAFGKEFLTAATEAMDKRKLKPVLAVTVESNASDAVAASDQVLNSNPEAVLLGLAGKPTIAVIKSINQRKRGTQMYALSVLASAANLRTLGADGTGVAITQVVPFPVNSTLPLVREYQQAMTAAGHAEFSHLSLEGYTNAKVVTEGLRRAGQNLTRAGLVKALNGMNNYDLGGMPATFGRGAASGSRFVELTLINSQGKLIK